MNELAYMDSIPIIEAIMCNRTCVIIDSNRPMLSITTVLTDSVWGWARRASCKLVHMERDRSIRMEVYIIIPRLPHFQGHDQ